MQVNLESFVLYNAAMNALLLLGTGRLSGLRAKAWRIAISVLAGTLFAVISSLSIGSFLQAWYWKLLCAAAMTAFAFFPNKPRRLLRAGACFFLAALLMGGTGFSLMYMLGARGFGWGIAGVLAVAGILGCVALGCGLKRARFGKVLRDVCVEYDGRRAEFTAMIDTGNSLSEPLSGIPVMVVERAVIGGIEPPAGRPVAFSSMAGGGTLRAFEPDRLTINGGECARIAVAVYDGSLCDDGRYAALLPWPCETEGKGRHLTC